MIIKPLADGKNRIVFGFRSGRHEYFASLKMFEHNTLLYPHEGYDIVCVFVNGLPLSQYR